MSNTGLSADARAMMAFDSRKKSVGTAFLFWFFTGGVGGHNFYLGRTGAAVTQLILAVLGWPLLFAAGAGILLLGPLGIWLIIDAIGLSGAVRKHNEAVMAGLNLAATPAHSPVEELAKFAALKDQGAISPEEFEAQKRRLIGPAPTAAPAEAPPVA